MNRDFWRATGIRALRTFLQVILAVWTAGQLITEVDWKFLLLSAFSSALYSVLTSIATGLPEVGICHEMTDEEVFDLIDNCEELEEELGEYEEADDDE